MSAGNASRPSQSLPAGITVEGATPQRGGVSGGPKGGPLTPARWRTSGQKRGVAPSTCTLLLRREPRAGRGGDTQGAASLRLVALGAGNPCYPVSNRAFRESSQPQRRGAPPSERRALWLLKARATYARHRGFFGDAFVCLHRIDPRRRKLSTRPATGRGCVVAAFDAQNPAIFDAH